MHRHVLVARLDHVGRHEHEQRCGHPLAKNETRAQRSCASVRRVRAQERIKFSAERVVGNGERKIRSANDERQKQNCVGEQVGQLHERVRRQRVLDVVPHGCEERARVRCHSQVFF